MKLLDINDIRVAKEKLNELFLKYNDIVEFQKSVKEALSVCEKIGSSKSFVSVLKVNSKLALVFEENGLSNLLDEANYDYLPTFNESNTELKNKLQETLDSLNSISKEIFKACHEQYKEFNRVGNDGVLLTKEYFSKALEELSNTSREVIPSKAREIRFQCHPIEGGRINIDSPKTELTLDELNRDDVIELTDQTLKGVSTFRGREYLSEVPKELKASIESAVEHYEKELKMILSSMAVIENFKSCC